MKKIFELPTGKARYRVPRSVAPVRSYRPKDASVYSTRDAERGGRARVPVLLHCEVVVEHQATPERGADRVIAEKRKKKKTDSAYKEHF